jgi:hypothetical protein
MAASAVSCSAHFTISSCHLPSPCTRNKTIAASQQQGFLAGGSSSPHGLLQIRHRQIRRPRLLPSRGKKGISVHASVDVASAEAVAPPSSSPDIGEIPIEKRMLLALLFFPFRFSFRLLLFFPFRFSCWLLLLFPLRFFVLAVAAQY